MLSTPPPPPPPRVSLRGFPRTIWIFWEQGWENAPELVKHCLRSWEYCNPGWTIHALDRENYSAFADLRDLAPAPNDDFTVQCLSDVLRLSLLAAHGGIWVDATCLCLRPLDEWLFDHLDSGFFSFERNGYPVLWFIATVSGSRLMNVLLRETHAYWRGCPPRLRAKAAHRGDILQLLRSARRLALGRQSPKRAVDYPLRILGKFINRHAAIYFSWLFRDVLKIVPYLWPYFLFVHIYQKKKYAHLRQIWDETPKVGDPSYLELGGLDELFKPARCHWHKVDEERMPMIKLTRDLDLAKAVPGTFLDYLLTTIPADGESACPSARAASLP